MEVLVCVCGHPCHCKGVGPTPNTAQCLTVKGCGCYNCNHNIKEEGSMVKKIIKRIWKIICWPWNKLMDWLKSSLPKG